jgi:hypothetical protein
MGSSIRLRVIFSTIILFFGCSKSNENPTTTVWSFNGISYTAVNTGYDTVAMQGDLIGQDANENYVSIIFNSHPTSNVIFNVISNNHAMDYTGSNCKVAVGNYNSPFGYGSTGKSGETVNLTFVNGKMHAVFNNITITNLTDTTTVSGTLIQNK